MGYFASIFVPPWFHPLIRLSPIPLGSLVAIIANLLHVRSYVKGNNKGLLEYVYRESLLDSVLKSKIADAMPGPFNAEIELESLALYKALMAQAGSLPVDDRFTHYMAAAKAAMIGSEDKNAVEALRLAIMIKPYDVIANFRLARFFERIGSASGAIAAYEIALLDPTIDSRELKEFIAGQVRRVKEKGPEQRSPIPGIIYQLM